MLEVNKEHISFKDAGGTFLDCKNQGHEEWIELKINDHPEDAFGITEEDLDQLYRELKSVFKEMKKRNESDSK